METTPRRALRHLPDNQTMAGARPPSADTPRHRRFRYRIDRSPPRRPAAASGKAAGPRALRNQGRAARGPGDRVSNAPGAWPGPAFRFRLRRGLRLPSGRWFRAMLSRMCGRLASALRPPGALVSRRPLHGSGRRLRADGSEGAQAPPRAFDPALLEFLVCPLSKKPLRYEASTNELINEELGIAYPIIDGIPNMIPQAARSTRRSEPQEDAERP